MLLRSHLVAHTHHFTYFSSSDYIWSRLILTFNLMLPPHYCEVMCMVLICRDFKFIFCDIALMAKENSRFSVQYQSQAIG